MAKPKLIIFDWDDVFTLGSTDGYMKCYHAAAVGVGVILEPEEEKRRIQAKWGQPHLEEIAELLQENPELVEQARSIYEENLFGDTFVGSLQIVPGAPELLRQLSGKYLLAIATGLHPRILRERVMPKFDIPDVFCQVLSVYDHPEYAKPSPRMVQEILKAQNIAPSQAILVGDAKGDVLMARSAGVGSVVVLTGHLSREEAQNLEVDRIIENVTLLTAELENME